MYFMEALLSLLWGVLFSDLYRRLVEKGNSFPRGRSQHSELILDLPITPITSMNEVYRARLKGFGKVV